MIRRILTSDFARGFYTMAFVIGCSAAGLALSNPPADPVVIALSDGVNQ